MISRSQPGPGQLFPSSTLPFLLSLYPQLNLAQAKTIKGKFSNVAHIQYIYLCVCVRVHRISFMTHPPPWSRCRVTGGRQQEFTMTPVSWLHNLLHLHMAEFVPQSAWESTPSRGYLTTLSRRCYRLLPLLLHPRLQQVHLNIQFQLAIPVPDFSFSSLLVLLFYFFSCVFFLFF